MSIDGLRSAIYHVPDLARAKAWYSEALGRPPYFDMPFYVGFEVNGFELGLDPDLTEAPAGPGGAVPTWRVTGIEAVVAHLQSIGAAVKAPVYPVGDDMKVAMVADPFGNLIGLIEERATG